MSTTPTGAKCKTSASKRSDGNIKDNERIYFFPDICIFQHTYSDTRMFPARCPITSVLIILDERVNNSTIVIYHVFLQVQDLNSSNTRQYNWVMGNYSSVKLILKKAVKPRLYPLQTRVEPDDLRNIDNGLFVLYNTHTLCKCHVFLSFTFLIYQFVHLILLKVLFYPRFEEINNTLINAIIIIIKFVLLLTQFPIVV